MIASKTTASWKGPAFASSKTSPPLRILLTIFTLLVFASTSLFAYQINEIRGSVKSAEGEAIAGASITVKGKTTGVNSDAAGLFSISAAPGDVLVITAVGYLSQELTVQANQPANLTLVKEFSEMNQVVVVGYGRQKKVNLTGSVATVSSEELLKRPTPNLQNMLQGRVAGLQVTQGTGQPGKEGSGISIRGQGSYGASSAPLVLIDGVLGNLANVAPEDVENISVLKDAASSAIYGARAANGVILVTTKRGKAGKQQITYTNNFGSHSATRMPSLIWNSVETMEMFNSAAAHSNGTIYFSQGEIDAYRNGQQTDPNQYPSFNWLDHTLQNAFAHNHYIGLNGGTEKATYNASAAYYDQQGVLPGHNYKRFTGNLSLNAKVNSWMSFGSNIAVMQRTFHEPWLQNDDYVLLIYSQTGLTKPYLPDGSGRYTARAYEKIWQNRNPIALANEGGRDRTDYNIRAQANLDITPFKDLVWSTKVAATLDEAHDRTRAYDINSYYYHKSPTDADYPYAGNQWPTIDNGMSQFQARTRQYTLFSTLNYNKTIGFHDISLLGGYSQENQIYDQMSGSRIGIPFSNINELDAGTPTGQSVGGTANEWAIRSYFGRAMYNFKETYFLEANLRYDGTSRIYKDNRWGAFPSFSAGWRLSKEKFLSNVKWLDEAKIRVSYGELGNQEIGNYPFQNILDPANYNFGGGIAQGVYVNRLTDRNLRWETTRLINLGFDYSMKSGLFAFSLDLYKKETSDILYQQPIPASVGLSAPTVNFGAMENKGFDLEVSHRNRIGELRYTASAILSAYRNNTTKLLSTSIGGSTIVQEGQPWNSFYLYDWIGVFQSQEEIDKSPQQPYNPKPGDLKFRDLNGDNVINGDDRKIFAGAHPKFQYSLNLNLDYKNFDMTIFFQGVQGRKLFVKDWGFEPFAQGGAAPTIWRDAWTPENPTNKLPHVYVWGYAPVSGMNSSFFLQDASYLRLKNLQIGYRIPERILQRASIKGLRIYFSGDNLLTFTKYEGADPERAGSGRYAQFPQVRILSGGINLTL